MSLAATVLIPTHDHGPTLLRAARSALAQTTRDLEVFVVGDGVPDETRELMADLVRRDARVRFFDNAKGPRHGEVHRSAALLEASGEIVCYLSDDDLWLPDHVETMRVLLRDHDFAHTLPLWIAGDGSFAVYDVDLSDGRYRERQLAGINAIPLSCGGHTLASYRRLPYGWRTTPAELPTDLYMWQQFLSQPGIRVRSAWSATVVHLPSPGRAGWTVEERLAELDAWVERVGDAQAREDFRERALEALGASRAERALQLSSREAERDDLRRQLDGLGTELIEVERDRAQLSRRLDALGALLTEVDHERADLSRRLDALAAQQSQPRLTLPRRLFRLATRVPGLGGPLRAAAKARARRAAH
jgi:hypothetical protein